MGIKITHGAPRTARMTGPPKGEKVKPFNLQQNPYNPQTGKFMALGVHGQDLAIQAFTVFSERDNYLVCINQFNQQVLVAKPYELRRLTYDGLTVDEVAYTYEDEDVGARMANNERQLITPPYAPDEESDDRTYMLILAVKHANIGVGNGVTPIIWEDLNTAGRSWKAAEASAMFKIVSLGTDVALCHTWDGETEGTESIPIALPYMLRRTPFDGQTRNGVSYSYTNAYTRTASVSGEDDITEHITPSYQAGDVVDAIAAKTGVTYGGNAVTLKIIGDGRAWGESDE